MFPFGMVIENNSNSILERLDNLVARICAYGSVVIHFQANGVNLIISNIIQTKSSPMLAKSHESPFHQLM